MTNRRVDAVYFVLIVSVAAIGYLASNVASNRFSDNSELPPVPDYSPAPIVFDVPFEPFELPFHFMKFERAQFPTLMLSSNMESALVEVRSALLVSSAIVEVQQLQPQLQRTPQGLLAVRE